MIKKNLEHKLKLKLNICWELKLKLKQNICLELKLKLKLSNIRNLELKLKLNLSNKKSRAKAKIRAKIMKNDELEL